MSGKSLRAQCPYWPEICVKYLKHLNKPKAITSMIKEELILDARLFT
jgi:hypothetical protein